MSPAPTPNGITAYRDVIRRARFCFRESVAESYGRHIRSVERWLVYDQGFDLARIHIIFSQRLPLGVARLMIVQAQYEKVVGDHVLLPGETTSGTVIAKHVFIAVGVYSDPDPHADKEERAKRPATHHEAGRNLPFYEEHMHPKARIALGHELGHLALGHLIDTENQLRVPRDLSERHDEEDAAKLYALALAFYSRSYLSDQQRVSKLTPGNDDLRQAASEIWGATVAPGTPLGKKVDEVLAGKEMPGLEGYDREND